MKGKMNYGGGSHSGRMDRTKGGYSGKAGDMDYGSSHGGGTVKKTVRTDRGRFRMEEGRALDNQAMPHSSPDKGFNNNGPTGGAGGYDQDLGD